MTTATNNPANAVNTAVEGTTTVAVMAFFSEAMKEIIPWLALAVPFIVLDLMYGIRAAKHRGEKVRLSTAIRRSVDKTMSYVMWCAAAVMLSQLFEVEWLCKLVLGLVYGNEFISIVGNYLETKNIELSFAGVWRFIFKNGLSKVGVDATTEDIKEIIKENKDEVSDSAD